MEVIIDEDAREFIRKKSLDNSITITAIRSGCGWASFYAPSVLMGPPIDRKKYDIYESHGIRVYLDTKIRIKEDKFRIKLDRFLWMKQIKAVGVVVWSKKALNTLIVF